MNYPQLALLLRRAPLGSHDIGSGWTQKEVLDVWEANATQRRRQSFNVSVWDGGRTVCIQPFAHGAARRADAVKCACIAGLLAAACLTVFAILPADASGGQCELAQFDTAGGT